MLNNNNIIPVNARSSASYEDINPATSIKMTTSITAAAKTTSEDSRDNYDDNVNAVGVVYDEIPAKPVLQTVNQGFVFTENEAYLKRMM